MQSDSRNGATVRHAVVHTTEGILRAADLRDWAAWPGSSHASADADGVLLEGDADGFVSYDRAAWTLRSGNPVSDNLELCAFASWTRDTWLSKPLLLERAAQWIASRVAARGIPLVKLIPAEVALNQPGVIDHSDWTYGKNDGTHWDVGSNFPWDVVMGRAAQINHGGSAAPTEEEELMAAKDDIIGALMPQLQTIAARSLQGRPFALIRQSEQGAPDYGLIVLCGPNRWENLDQPDVEVAQNLGIAGEVVPVTSDEFTRAKRLSVG